MIETTGDKPASAVADRLDGVVSTTATLTTEYGETMIKVNKGDMNITQLYEEVLEPLLLGAGYSKETIDSLFEC